MSRNFIDDDVVVNFLSANPGATAMELQAHLGSTITGVRSKLRKMVVASRVECQRIDNRNRYKIRETPVTFGSANQALLNRLLGRGHRTGVSK